ncbi:response regulator [Oscillochloris sp. ZM17-4]|uniref:response regulator n=1 Tax=Oscillochloris sp. ZM17-4 TaxID=2866714 RepID=UPI001C73BCD8|nr:response regulator [Oscillochloris sp. ZM17-4]MBX0329973.1 response regulator [Oscillochloris sp. ZM17-4]
MPKVLIVEDDKINREMIERMLSLNGYEVISASDGAKALAMARTHIPDVIIMDMGLPVLNGWQATYRLKADESTRRIPVIALTAFTMSEDRTRCLAVGCDDYDVKPIEMTRLLTKLRVNLERAAEGFVPDAPTLDPDMERQVGG